MLEKLLSHLMTSLPPSLQSLKTDLEDHLHHQLTSLLAETVLVTREEFEIQMAVLQKTRLKLETLEKKVLSPSTSAD